jgi:hypothetical protein
LEGLEFDENKAYSDLHRGPGSWWFLSKGHQRANQVRDGLSMGCKLYLKGVGGQHLLWLWMMPEYYFFVYYVIEDIYEIFTI